MQINAGLCGTCEHVKHTVTDRGSVFIRCGLAQSDKMLRKYPPLPVLQCHGYRPQVGDELSRPETIYPETT